MSAWIPKPPPAPPTSTTFIEWIEENDPEIARAMGTECQCGVEVAYKKSDESKFYHSYYCPKYIKPERKVDHSKKWK